LTVGWLSFDILLFDDVFGVVGIGDAWMVILAEVKRKLMMMEKYMTCLMMKIQTTKLVNQNTGHQVPGVFFSFLSIFSFIEHFSSIGRISI